MAGQREAVHDRQASLMGVLVKYVLFRSSFLLDSGSAAVAALQLGYRFTGIEKSARYFDVARRRIENHVASSQFTEPTRPALV